MNQNMTRISRGLFEQATAQTLTIQEAAVLLNEHLQLRTLHDKIEKYGNGSDVKKVIAEALLLHHPEAKKDAVERKVRGWFNDAERTIDKNTAIELAFILKLDLTRANEFIALVSEEQLHLRNPEELVFAYALKTGKSYVEATALIEKANAIVSLDEKIEESKEHYTALIKNDLEEVETDEEFLSFLEENKTRFGTLHNTAHAFYTEYVDLLLTPDSPEYSDMPKEGFMGMREVLDLYFNNALIPRFKKKGGDEKRSLLSAVHKNILQSWPDEFSASKMKNREQDVSRKALILAFLATNGGEGKYGLSGDDSYEDEDMYEDEFDEEDDFSDMYKRMNYMLDDCGFAPLDPRIPFDWMILYCMAVTDTCEIDDLIGDKKRSILKELFEETKS